MAREEFFHDRSAPPANSIVPTAFAAVRDGRGRVLLVRRTDSGNWELPGGRVEFGESAITAAEREIAEACAHLAAHSSRRLTGGGWRSRQRRTQPAGGRSA